MVTRSDGNALFVEEHTHIVVVNVSDKERDYAAFMVGCAENAHSGDFHKTACSVVEELLFVLGNVVDAESVDVVDSLSECGNADKVGCSGFELIG